MIGHLAKTYGLLPSQVAAQATTFDIMVADVSATWEKYQRDPSSVDNYDTAELEKMFREVNP